MRLDSFLRSVAVGCRWLLRYHEHFIEKMNSQILGNVNISKYSSVLRKLKFT